MLGTNNLIANVTQRNAVRANAHLPEPLADIIADYAAFSVAELIILIMAHQSVPRFTCRRHMQYSSGISYYCGHMSKTFRPIGWLKREHAAGMTVADKCARLANSLYYGARVGPMDIDGQIDDVARAFIAYTAQFELCCDHFPDLRAAEQLDSMTIDMLCTLGPS